MIYYNANLELILTQLIEKNEKYNGMTAKINKYIEKSKK